MKRAGTLNFVVLLAIAACVALDRFRLIAGCNALVAMGLEHEYARRLESYRYARSTTGHGDDEGPLSRSVGFVLTKQIAFTRDVWSQSGQEHHINYEISIKGVSRE